jgi:adenine phosphoribosyltransferase
MNLDALVRSIPDFPKPGILFRDISPLLASPAALHEVARKLVEPFDLSLVEAFVGIESRGFILAALLAFTARDFSPYVKPANFRHQFKLKVTISSTAKRRLKLLPAAAAFS